VETRAAATWSPCESTDRTQRKRFHIFTKDHFQESGCRLQSRTAAI